MNEYIYGFIAGSLNSPIDLRNWCEIFQESLSGKSFSECYHSAFLFDRHFVEHVRETGSRANYYGNCFARFIPIDIDSESLEESKRTALRLFDHFTEISIDGILVFFSGKKGFHLYLPIENFGVNDGSQDFNKTCRTFVETEASKVDSTIDSSVYDKTRLFRLPNSQHPKTNLFKRYLLYEELKTFNCDEIRNLAQKSCEVPIHKDVIESPKEKELWSTAIVKSQQKASLLPKNSTEDDGRVMRKTMEYIRNGVSTGDRAVRLYSAARNLADLSVPTNIIYDLLTPSSEDSGLDYREMMRQIEAGIDASGRGRD